MLVDAVGATPSYSRVYEQRSVWCVRFVSVTELNRFVVSVASTLVKGGPNGKTGAVNTILELQQNAVTVRTER